MTPVEYAKLQNRSVKLEQRLAKGWDWLSNTDNKTHPKYREHETLWIDLLHEYEQSMNTLANHSNQERLIA